MLHRLGMVTVILALFAGAPPVGGADPARVLVVANPEVPCEVITPRELQRIYLGKTTRWEGDLAIRPVMLQDDEVHAVFVTELLERSQENFSVYWKRIVFTGKGRPPQTFADPAALTAFLRATPGAIGFLPVGSDVAGLKVLQVD